MSNILSSILITIATIVAYPFSVQTPVVPPQVIIEKPVIQNTLTPQMADLIDAYLAKSSLRLGAAPIPIAGSTYNLSGAGISSSATSITLQSLTIVQTGQKIVTADLRTGASDKFYITVDPGNRTRQEIVSCTTVTQNASTATLSGCSRGLSPITPYAASTTLSFVHAGGAQVIFGDAPQLFRDIISYVDSAVVSGAVDSSLTAKGIVEKATANEAASNTAVGGGNTTAPLALTTDIASSTRTANTIQVVIASSTGYIDNSYIATSTSQGGTLALFNNPIFTGTTTMATSTSYFTGGIRLIEIGKNSQIFSSTGTTTFSVPSGVSRVYVRLVGGGGGGGQGGTTNYGGAGGAGGYSEKIIDVTGTTSIQVFVGAGGAASVDGGAAEATNGQWSTFGTNGSYFYATGGSLGTNSTPGGGGSGTNGDWNIAGTPGRFISTTISGWGGTSYFGVTYGGGGSPGQDSGAQGGVGTQGIVIVTW